MVCCRGYGALGIPCATVIGGGYDKDRARVAARHGISVSAAASIFPDKLVGNTV